ncbi:MAG: hypothetical protein IPF96_05040 [Rhodobacter sp.]|nr:hypothetical protein [Rhodobacter sp.]
MARRLDHRLKLWRQIAGPGDRTEMLDPLFLADHGVIHRPDQQHRIGPPVPSQPVLGRKERQKVVVLRQDLGQPVGAQVHRRAQFGHLFGDLGRSGRLQRQHLVRPAQRIAGGVGDDLEQPQRLMRQNCGARVVGLAHQPGQFIRHGEFAVGHAAVPVSHKPLGGQGQRG